MFYILLIYLLIVLIAFHYVCHHEYHLPKYIQRVEQIPGPKGVFYFGNILHFYHLKTEEKLSYIIQIFKTWGPTVKLWFSGVAIVLISDVDDIQVVLTSKFKNEKGMMYEHLKPWLGTGLLTSKGEKWKMMRKIITPTFHFSILQEYISVFTKNAKIMMDILSRGSKGDVYNLGDSLVYCTLDSICETSMGKCMNSQITKSENEYVRAIFQMDRLVVKRLFSPFLFLDRVFMLSPLGRESSNLLKTLHGVTSKLIQERKQQHFTPSLKSDEDEELRKKKMPFLDLLIEKQKIYCFSDEDLREEVDTVLMAGHDTTSTALSWCLFELGYKESIQDKIYEELQQILDSEREPTYQDLMKMEYLKRVLQETLRLYPSVPVVSRKFDVDIHLKEYVVPANTEIVLVLYHIHRNPKIFPNPEVFDPDRFLPELVNERNPFAYIPFSAGARNCVGQKYAMLQMMVILSYILRKYKVKTLNKRESVKAVPDVILRPSVQLNWKLTPRT